MSIPEGGVYDASLSRRLELSDADRALPWTTSITVAHVQGKGCVYDGSLLCRLKLSDTARIVPLAGIVIVGYAHR